MHFLENKVPPPIVALTCAALMWFMAGEAIALSPYLRYPVIALLLLTGLGFSGAGVRNFGRAKTTVNPLKPETASALVTSGVYQITRNPMYVGMAFVLCAWAVFLASPPALLFVIVFIFYIHRFQILPEERALDSLFGEEYSAYRKQVRPWL